MRWRGHRDFPGGPAVSPLSMQGVWVPSLVRETKISCGTAENKVANRPQRTLPQQTSHWNLSQLLRSADAFGNKPTTCPVDHVILISHFRLRCSLDIWKQRGPPLFREHLPSFLVVSSAQMIISIWWYCSQLRGSWLWCFLWEYYDPEWDCMGGRGAVREAALWQRQQDTICISRSIWRCLFNKYHSKISLNLSQVTPTYQASVYVFQMG